MHIDMVKNLKYRTWSSGIADKNGFLARLDGNTRCGLVGIIWRSDEKSN